MRGDNHFLAVTTAPDPITGEPKPLFGFPVQVCKATGDGGDIKFDIAAPSGAERAIQYLDTATGEVVADEDCKRGIRVGGTFREVPKEAIDAIAKQTKRETMVALGQVDVADLPWDRVTGRYFLQSPAKGGSPKAYRLVYEALRGSPKKGKKAAVPGKAIVTKRTARSRQKLAAIYADERLGCLVMVEMAFAAALRDPDDAVLAPSLAEVEEAHIDKARQVIAGLGDGHAALEAEVDEAVALKAELVEKASQGVAIEAPAPEVTTATADDGLMAALEASIGAAPKARKAKAAA